MLGQNPSDFSKIQVVSFQNHEISLNPSVFSLNPSDLQTPPHPPGGYVEPLVRKNLIFMYFLTSTIFIYFDHLVPLTTLLPCPSSFSSLASTMMNILQKIHLFQMEIHIKPTFEVLISLYYSFCSKFWKQNYKISFVILLVFDLFFESETHATGEKLLGLPEANCTTRFAPT